MMLDLDALRTTDFRRPRPDPAGPGRCPACAMVVEIIKEVCASRDPALLEVCVELGFVHAVVGHPWDRSEERRYFLARLRGEEPDPD